MEDETNPAVKLSESLRNIGVKVCIWKNPNEVEPALEGREDLDILLLRSDVSAFKSEAQKFGFIEGVARFINYSYIYHFYALDPISGSIIHLHVHTRLMTGESHTKNFWLPYESMLLDSAEKRVDVFSMPSVELLYWVHVLRLFIKISSLPSLFVLWRKKNVFAEELNYFLENSSVLEDILDNQDLYARLGISKEFASNLLDTYKNRKVGVRSALLGCQLRIKIRHLNRYGFFAGLLDRYSQIAYRVVNKLFLKRKKRPVDGGTFIAFVGTDGAGKSTITSEMKRWFGQVFDTKLYHIGRPGVTLLSLPYRVLIALYRKKRGGANDLLLDNGSAVKKDASKLGVLKAAHYLAVSYERYREGIAISKHVSRGGIAISDRYPSREFGVMDSPRIGLNHDRSVLRLMGRLEAMFYQKIPVPDLIVRLQVSVSTAIDRNRTRVKSDKETSEEIAQRHHEQVGLSYNANISKAVSGDGELSETINEVKKAVWEVL